MVKKLMPLKAFEKRGGAFVGQGIGLAVENSEVIVIAPNDEVAMAAGQMLGCRAPDVGRIRQVAVMDARVHDALAGEETGLVHWVAQLINSAGTPGEGDAMRNLSVAYEKFQAAQLASKTGGE